MIGRPEPAKKTTGNRPEPTIAVLPFVDMSPDKDQDHFCEGMAQMDWITHDTDLDNLREHPRFKALLPSD